MRSNNKLVVVLLAMILLVGALLWWNQDGVQKAGVDILVPATSTPTTASAVTENDTRTYEPLAFPDNNLNTSDWQTYRNEEFGFEVRYPRGWQVSVLNKGDLDGLVDEDNSGIEFIQNRASVGVRIFFSPTPFPVMANRVIEWARKGNTPYKYVRVGEAKGISLAKHPDSLLGPSDYSFGDDNGTVTFTGIEGQEEILEQMLLSLKFTR